MTKPLTPVPPTTILGKTAVTVRDRYDYYPTPVCATLKLCDNVVFDGNIHEPASGDGAISLVLKHLGYNTRSSDIQREDWIHGRQGVDFLNRYAPMANMVTNPPFKLRYDFIRHGWPLVERKMCLLLNSAAAFVGNIGYDMWQSHRPNVIYKFAKYLPYMKDGKWSTKGGLYYHAWYVWDKSLPQDGRVSFYTLWPDKKLITMEDLLNV